MTKKEGKLEAKPRSFLCHAEHNQVFTERRLQLSLLNVAQKNERKKINSNQFPSSVDFVSLPNLSKGQLKRLHHRLMFKRYTTPFRLRPAQTGATCITLPPCMVSWLEPVSCGLASQRPILSSTSRLNGVDLPSGK